jgi:hypothetical protein
MRIELAQSQRDNITLGGGTQAVRLFSAPVVVGSRSDPILHARPRRSKASGFRRCSFRYGLSSPGEDNNGTRMHYRS